MITFFFVWVYVVGGLLALFASRVFDLSMVVTIPWTLFWPVSVPFAVGMVLIDELVNREA